MYPCTIFHCHLSNGTCPILWHWVDDCHLTCPLFCHWVDYRWYYYLTAFQVMAYIYATFWDPLRDWKNLSSTWSQTPRPLHQPKAETKGYLLVISNHRRLRCEPRNRPLTQGALMTNFSEHTFITRKSMHVRTSHARLYPLRRFARYFLKISAVTCALCFIVFFFSHERLVQ